MATSIDDLTAGTIRQALTAASAGRLSEAVAIGERGLSSGGDPAALHAMLGMLQTRSGNLAGALDHLTAAHRARPTDFVIGANLAMALTQLERHREALDVVSIDLARSDPSFRLLRLRGFLAQTVEDFATAVQAYEEVVAANPTDWESWNNLGNARRCAGDGDGAVAALSRALELSPGTAPVQLNLATALEYAGKMAEAEQLYRQMAADFPGDEKPMRELFAMLKSQYRDDEALDALEEAVRRAPSDVELILGLASHRLTRGRHAAAEEAYRRVLAIEPANTLAFLGVATVLDQTNRTDELSALVGEAQTANVSAEGQSFVKAFDHRRAKRYSEGLEALSHVPDELETARRQQLLGQLLEGAGDYDEAFAAFERMNAITRADPSEPEQRAVAYRDQIRNQRESLSAEWVRSWRPAQIDQRPSPAFLVGFPRSGTTLLDTILMSHPGIEVLEEEPTLMRATEALGGFGAIADASDEALGKARDAYFETARSLTPLEPGKLLIDKNPLAMNSLPVIRRLFPDARIILALRHPCDVVLSCFVTNFKPNNAMVNFLSLATAAEVYDLSFGFLEKARELLQPALHTTVYEKLVADRDHELRPLFEFLGLEWDERVMDHQSTALSRGHIKTASYAQVVEPIYQRSAGRWLNYRKHLEPVLPVLEPWVRKFGYDL
ncbi:MAG: sulfotransferase [Sphingomicrobium sp.]